MHTSSPTRFWTIDRIMWLLIGLAVCSMLIWLMRYLSNVLLPFFAACLIAYLLQPIVEFNQRLTRTKGRTLASILTIIDMSAIISIVIYLFTPSVLSELDMLEEILHDVSSGRKTLSPTNASLVSFIDRYFDPDNLKALLTGSRLEDLINRGSSLLEESLDIVMQILAWLLTLIYILFILIDYPQICHGFKMIIPHQYRPQLLPVVHEVTDSMNRYFRGQGLVALFAAIFYCTGFSIIHLPLAIPLGLLVGILYMIPYFQYVTLVPVAAICFIYSLGGDVEFLPELGKCGLVYIISQSVCDYIITPHVMGKEMGLNPAVILLSLSVWGSLLGIIGMIIALPVSAMIITYYERYISEPRPKSADEVGTKKIDCHPDNQS